jgi:hypothetical protein
MPDQYSVAILEKMDAAAIREWITQLIDNDFMQLVQVLYRLDVSEEKLKQELADCADGDTAGIITSLVLQRIEQIRKTRQMFRSPGDIPEDEKW